MTESNRYSTIVTDPPWHYEEFGTSPTSRKAAPRGDGKRRPRPLPYASLSVEEIHALPIGAMAADACALFLWATSRYLPDAFEAIRAWEFEYGQTIVWRKTGNPTPFGGVIAANHAEFLLVAKRGRPRLGRLPSSVVEAPAPQCGQHSQKPEVFLDLIEQIAPGPYVELFARRARFGWDYWGDQSLGTADMSAA